MNKQLASSSRKGAPPTHTRRVPCWIIHGNTANPWICVQSALPTLPTSSNNQVYSLTTFPFARASAKKCYFLFTQPKALKHVCIKHGIYPLFFLSSFSAPVILISVTSKSFLSHNIPRSPLLYKKQTNVNMVG